MHMALLVWAEWITKKVIPKKYKAQVVLTACAFFNFRHLQAYPLPLIFPLPVGHYPF